MQVEYVYAQTILPLGATAQTDLLLRFRMPHDPAVATRRPLNLSIVIDRSGSMAGNPLRYAQQAAESLVNQLEPGDLISIVVYDDSVTTLFAPQPVGDRVAVLEALSRVRPGGCTNLAGGWLEGCKHVQANATPERINRVLLLTDGQANVGITDPALLIQTAHQKADLGIVTTTLGFGNHFNEDLLIPMAQAAGGNFYYIQSLDDAADVFRIELESLLAVAAQNLTVTLEPAPGVEIIQPLSRYRQTGDNTWHLGDVYATEDKRLALVIKIASPGTAGEVPVLQLRAQYSKMEGESSVVAQANQALVAVFGSLEDAAMASVPFSTVIELSKVRIASAKDAALEAADRGEGTRAVQELRATVQGLRDKGLHETFEIAEELDQLEFFAQQIETRQLGSAGRKEMRDQSFQASARGRADLSQRGTSAGDASALPVATDLGAGVELVCVREGGKLRVHTVTDGYNPDFNVQFPRALRDEGIRYHAEGLELSSDGTFYRAVGALSRLVRPGETDPYAARQSRGRTQAPRAAAPAKPALTAADLPTTDSVGDGILVHCIKEGSKLRVRVVSDGYDPNWNMRFPRSIREEGVLYIVDNVVEVSGGGQYMVTGEIKRFVQTT
jgi:Ca-activated chloride channel homolog